MTTMTAAAAVSRAAVVATRRRAMSAVVMFRSWTAAMGRGEPAAETFRSSTTAMEGAGLAAAKFRSWNIAIGRATGRGETAAARSDRVPATRGIGRDLRRGRLASASATALCWAIRHRIGLAGWLVVLRMMRPPATTRTLCAGTIRCSKHGRGCWCGSALQAAGDGRPRHRAFKCKRCGSEVVEPPCCDRR
jgi:hypothetical protein